MPATDALAAPGRPDRQARDVARRLVVAWQHPEERRIEPVGFLFYDGHSYRFSYIRNVLRIRDFRPLLGFADLRASYVSDHLFPLFAQRAMDPRRPDYRTYLERLGLRQEAGPLEQIARSQGRRQGDTIQLLPVPTMDGTDLTVLFLANGVRHVPERVLTLDGRQIRPSSAQVEAALGGLRPGDPLGLVGEPGNPVNPLAVVVTALSVPVGWVPNLLADDVHALLGHAVVTVTAEHVNGPESPWHLRLLARLRASGAAGFRFFAGEKWQSLSGEDQ